MDKQKKSGFTIVELLVVIVIIGILAAITIVSYTGITAKANTAKAQSNAQTVQQVVEVMATDNSGVYPATAAAINTYSGTTKVPAGITVVPGGTAVNAANGLTSVSYACVATTTTGPCLGTGGKITYWDFTGAGSNVIVYVGVGSSTSVYFNPTT